MTARLATSAVPCGPCRARRGSCRPVPGLEGVAVPLACGHRGGARHTFRVQRATGASLNSAVVTASPPGVFITTTRVCVAASTSTLSTPRPRAPHDVLFAASMTLRVTFVSERTTKAVASATTGASPCFRQPFRQHGPRRIPAVAGGAQCLSAVAHDDFHIKTSRQCRRWMEQGQTLKSPIYAQNSPSVKNRLMGLMMVAGNDTRDWSWCPD